MLHSRERKAFFGEVSCGGVDGEQGVGPDGACAPQVNALTLDGLMQMERQVLVLALTAGIGCSHSLPAASPSPPSSEPLGCYRPSAEPFRSPLPPGMTAEEGRAKGIAGALEKDDIRRIFESHLGEMGACYERALVNQPHLAGRVTMQFIVAGDGSVSDARLDSSTLNSPATEVCIAKQPCKWRFPPTIGGGPVIVTYPLKLQASGDQQP